MDCIRTRRAGKTKLTKVKGHVTEAMVAEGLSDEELKIGNDHSDEAAAKGSPLSQDPTQRMASIYARRQQGYRNFMVRIQNYIVKIYHVV